VKYKVSSVEEFEELYKKGESVERVLQNSTFEISTQAKSMNEGFAHPPSFWQSKNVA